ncbi:MAG: ankyrin repeat domain-containing protein [Planctomycetota bacterium]|nr:MAG: ankyrin repeat domain-containing protein [Planctomycetota bacterium]
MPDRILERIAGGRTDLVFDLLRSEGWRESIAEGRVNVLQWFVYYGDVTAMKAVLEAGGDLSAIDPDRELENAAFFGHWKMCDFLLAHGADAAFADPDTGETALHSALAKAGRPYYLYVVRLLLERGADVNARTTPGAETGAFMRDVRCCGETPLHRAAAYADGPIIRTLLDHGADREARDAHGDSPITWASRHLRPGAVLELLAFGDHRIGPNALERITSDHGAGWGNGMEWNVVGDYLPEST